MAPQSKIRAARILIPVALALGIVGVVSGNTVAGMARLVLSQPLNLPASRRELRDQSGLRLNRAVSL